MVIMRCKGMRLKNRELKLSVFWESRSSTELAPERAVKVWLFNVAWVRILGDIQ